jgi:hypothetical protein
VAQPTNGSPLSLETQIKKPSWSFWVPNHQAVVTGFEAQTGKPVPVVLKPNHWQTVDLGFDFKPRNPSSSCSCARYRLHIASLDLSIVRSPSTRPVLDYLQSSAPGLLLLPWSLSLPTISHLSPTRQKISKRDSPHKIESRIEPPKTFRIRIQTEASKLLIIIKLRYWSLGFSISHLMSTLTTQNHKVWNSSPRHMKHS